MVLVEVKVKSVIEISGHALFAKSGKDVVCAGISCVVFGALNALTQFGVEASDISVGSQDIKISFAQFNKKQKTVIETMMIQLETIQNSFPENITIRK